MAYGKQASPQRQPPKPSDPPLPPHSPKGSVPEATAKISTTGLTFRKPPPKFLRPDQPSGSHRQNFSDRTNLPKATAKISTTGPTFRKPPPRFLRPDQPSGSRRQNFYDRGEDGGVRRARISHARFFPQWGKEAEVAENKAKNSAPSASLRQCQFVPGNRGEWEKCRHSPPPSAGATCWHSPRAIE